MDELGRRQVLPPVRLRAYGGNMALQVPLLEWRAGLGPWSWHSISSLGDLDPNSMQRGKIRTPDGSQNGIVVLRYQAGVVVPRFQAGDTMMPRCQVGAEDSQEFLLNWSDCFSQYKGRDFYITGESYAGISDTDAVIPVTSTRYSITSPVEGELDGAAGRS
ncbi:hypothetical protein Ddye_021232 [Dipteronia dyeriana]|uniref:Carboxypeptidase n=1 Tax=Dipteronia dyeriana TaxID=168575 RepID=A0AAD9WXI4_9ROSI|nr:hypothetical protein Ddye_021232 [Dipteronia dyeriana]